MAAWKCSAVSHSAILMKVNPGARGECPAQARGDEAGLAAHVPRRLVPQGQRLPFPPLGDLEGVDQDHPAHRGCSLHRLAGGRGFRAPSAALASACSTHSPTVSPAAEAASSTAWRVRSLTPLIAHVLALGLAMAPLVAPATPLMVVLVVAQCTPGSATAAGDFTFTGGYRRQSRPDGFAPRTGEARFRYVPVTSGPRAM